MLKKEKYNDSLPKIKVKKWTPEGHHHILRVYVHVCEYVHVCARGRLSVLARGESWVKSSGTSSTLF